jgi:hypothetical protein
MTHDEMQHGAQAASLGGAELPVPVGAAMRLTSRLMTAGLVLAISLVNPLVLAIPGLM